MGKLKILIFLFCTVLISCESNSFKENEMTFEINKELLGESYIQTDFEISPPKAWEKLSDEQSKTIKDAIGKDSTDEQITLDAGFINDSYNSFLFISKLNSDFRDNLSTYISEIQNSNIENKLVESRYYYNGIDIIQLMIMKDENINIKLICSLPQTQYLVDYIISYDFYKESIKTIESSIGSIKKKEEKNEKN